MNLPDQRRGFTLVELVIVVSILAILAGVMVPRLSERMAKSRDARRLADIKAIKTAIETYYADNGSFPAPDTNATFGGWDVSHDGNFIVALQEEGYLPEQANDPVGDDRYHYRYYVYSQGSYSCRGTTPFYVLGIRNFETTEFSEPNKGFFKCSGRDWGADFAYVTGGGATFKQ
jgi:type II secretion system protein G